MLELVGAQCPRLAVLVLKTGTNALQEYNAFHLRKSKKEIGMKFELNGEFIPVFDT